MFTGIIEATGKILALEARGGDKRISVETGNLELAHTQLGDSIAVNGVCLTVIELLPKGFVADVSVETLTCTTLQGLQAGAPVNIEKALTLNKPLGGHWVSGHVDGVGKVIAKESQARSNLYKVQVPAELAKYIAPKGSICIDGVSLTVNTVEQAIFSVNIVPHTLEATIIKTYNVGSLVNIEVDIIARYLERLLLNGQDQPTSGITSAFLQAHGFKN